MEYTILNHPKLDTRCKNAIRLTCTNHYYANDAILAAFGFEGILAPEQFARMSASKLKYVPDNILLGIPNFGRKSLKIVRNAFPFNDSNEPAPADLTHQKLATEILHALLRNGQIENVGKIAVKIADEFLSSIAQMEGEK